MFVVFYAMVVGLAIAQILPVATVLVFASMPLMVRVWKVYGEPKPAESPFPNPVWPLVVRPPLVPGDPPGRRPADPRA